MTTVPASVSYGRIRELDALRGLLSMGVVGFHLFLQQLFWLWSGVDGFFVLSGFVITRLLFANPINRTTLISFYARRIFRIWPVYYLTLAAALAANFLYLIKNGIAINSIQGVPQSLFFLQFVQFYWTPYSGYFTYNYIHWFGHAWSLAVEDQFYWLWPMVVFAFRKKRSWLVPFCLLMMAVGIWSRYSGHLIFLLTTRIDGLALGAMLAMAESTFAAKLAAAPRLRAVVGGACGLLAAGCLGILGDTYIIPNYRASYVQNLHYQHTTWLITLFAATFASIVSIIWLYRDKPGLWFLRLRPLLWLGDRSYAIYMFHPLVQVAMERAAEHYGLPRLSVVLATVAITLFLAHLSCKYVEAFFASGRHRFPLVPGGSTKSVQPSRQ